MQLTTKALTLVNYTDRRENNDVKFLVIKDKSFKFKYTQKYHCRYIDIYILENGEVLTFVNKFASHYRSKAHFINLMLTRRSEIDIETLDELMRDYSQEFSEYISMLLKINLYKRG